MTTCALTEATIATRKSLRPIALSLTIIEKMDGLDKRCNELDTLGDSYINGRSDGASKI